MNTVYYHFASIMPQRWQGFSVLYCPAVLCLSKAQLCSQDYLHAPSYHADAVRLWPTRLSMNFIHFAILDGSFIHELVLLGLIGLWFLMSFFFLLIVKRCIQTCYRVSCSYDRTFLVGVPLMVVFSV